MIEILKNMLLLKASKLCIESKKLQNIRFKKLLKYVYQNSAFYRDLYSSCGITEKDLKDVQITDLPIIEKEKVMENIDSIFTVKDLNRDKIESYLFSLSENAYGKFFLNKYMILHTSGTSGVVGYFVYGKKDWNMLIALTMTRLAKSKPGFKGRYRIVFIGATEGNYAGCSIFRSAPSFIYDKIIIPISKPIQEILELVDTLKPDIISGYGSVMSTLAEAHLQNAIHIYPRHLYSSGEPITKKTYELTKEAWGIYPTNFYACTESVCLGVQKNPDREFELFNDFHIFEILDENKKEVGPKEEGTLVMTNLYNYTQPLIRYQLNDIVEKSGEEKSKNRYLTIRSVNGRRGRDLEYKNIQGEKIKISHHLLLEFLSPGVQRYQFFQTKPNELLMKVKMKNSDERYIREAKSRMDVILAKYNLQGCVKSKIEIVEEFYPNAKTGKFELIHPYNEQEAA